ncbi:lipoate--protein ligase family protein [Robertmurraya korlensis]|uniref:lipoate--protein ligase family protein n=1 Tax=Robertmurraya korlensis TaxID=519977 RepID=UPI0008265C6E|nr:lipoate--protein ligase family protein [Robertmurraya korlensis]
MEEAQKLLNQPTWRIIDQSSTGLHMSALHSFGYDDTLCASIGTKGAPATVRAWVHADTIVLGIQDTRLPFIKDGLEYLIDQNYEYIVRNSGGLAVVLDEGVLNLSIILPEQEKGIDINRGYDAMWELVQEMFADFGQSIEAREIVGSYCPGSYDLSIDGKKFAGISQRRLRGGVAVQIYLCVTGSGSERARVIQEFYERAVNNQETKFSYPKIEPSVMASLSELFGVSLTVQDVMLRLLLTLKKKAVYLQAGELTDDELKLLDSYVVRVVERNDKFLAEASE